MSASHVIAKPVYVYKGQLLAAYGFGSDHPFGTDRHDVFHRALTAATLGNRLHFADPATANPGQLALFHSDEYIRHVERMSERGSGFLDHGDTPVVPGIYEAALTVVGTTLAATDAIMAGDTNRAFVPIAGLHHASRLGAAGFCVFNDCGIAIEYLRKEYGIRRIAYVDIDAHHGDGVYYGFEDDPELVFADTHEDGRFLYPGTGAACETGKGEATGRKLNIPLPMNAGDQEFFEAWERIVALLHEMQPEFIILQAGADGLDGDPITHLRFTQAVHRRATADLCLIVDRYASGRLLATGGGGYNRSNLGRAWTAVVKAMVETE